MSDNQIADTEVDTQTDVDTPACRVGGQVDDEMGSVAGTAREEHLRALAAIHGGFGEDLLPGVPRLGPGMDADLFAVGGAWPHGWVAS